MTSDKNICDKNTIKRISPTQPKIEYEKKKEKCKGSLRCPNPQQSRTAAVTTRCRRRPLPGQLFGNVEKRRCKNTPFIFSLGYSQQAQNAQMKVSVSSFSWAYSSIIPRFNPIVTA